MRALACSLLALCVFGGGPSPSGRVTASQGSASTPGTDCSALMALTIPSVTIQSAEVVPEGDFEAGRARLKVPSFCRVRAVAAPTADSRIGIEVWLPLARSWNAKFLGVGNGGFSGSIGYAALAAAVARGYAAAGTDTGHSGDQMEFGQGHPERIADWAYRSIHLTAEIGKLVARNHYGRHPQWSYFNGCSTGGQQALSEAQRFPGDYDGIVAGAPGNNRIRLILGFLWGWAATHADDGTAILTQTDLDLLARGAMDACDGLDGLRDGILSDPWGCRFDPATLQCTGVKTPSCLEPAQVDAARKVYDGARRARTGERLYPGWTRGSEAGWRAYLVGPAEPIRLGLFRSFAFHNPDWNPRSFDWDRDVDFVESQVPYLSAVSTDYGAFRKRGGKLLMYTGLADPVVPAADPATHYEQVANASNGYAATQEFFRFFAVPGMGHCGGGNAPVDFDVTAAIERWVENGIPPRQLVASQKTSGAIARTRPLCPYPQVAKYRGAGSPDDAASFVCVAPASSPVR